MHNSLDMFKSIDLYHLNGQIIWYVNYINTDFVKKNPMVDLDLIFLIVWRFPCFHNILRGNEGYAYFNQFV